MQPLTAQESPYRIGFYVGKSDFPDQPGMGRLGGPISCRIDLQQAGMKGRPVFTGPANLFIGGGCVWRELREQWALLPLVRGQGRAAGFFDQGPVNFFQSKSDRFGSPFQSRS